LPGPLSFYWLLALNPRLEVSLSHLALVGGKCTENLFLLALGHREEVKRSSKFSRDLIEFGGRDLQFAVGWDRDSAGAPRLHPPR
jgi:hypothetical protein